ncbi:hypothetical protein [Streptomyces sp. NPDC088350]|uniref:hypothetical protein n=1 Tax=Streptomyces sp. NPDC088350 TaxID=3365854 RepID=UPI00382A3783
MPEGEVALALAELRATVEVGFARIDGQLALLVQRSDQTDKALEGLEQRVSSLETRRWPLATLTVLVAVAGLALGVFGALLS